MLKVLVIGLTQTPLIWDMATDHIIKDIFVLLNKSQKIWKKGMSLGSIACMELISVPVAIKKL